MRPLRVCLVGLPAAGKTSYLAALWAYVSAGPGDDTYQISGFPAQVAYLKQLGDQWFAGQRVDRNTIGTIHHVEFALHARDRQDLAVNVPDLPGEAFKQAVTARRIDRDIVSFVLRCDLLLFFINAGDARTFNALADFPLGDESHLDEVVAFDPEHLDSDLLNAELLQQLQFLMQDTPAAPAIAVVVSAWDLCTQSRMTPRQWLDDAQPMFSQLFDEASRLTGTAIFGVSAQGDDYSKNPTINQIPPLERPLVVTEDGSRSSNITLPFVWFDELHRPGSDEQH